MTHSIEDFQNSVNIAEDLDQETLDAIGSKMVELVDSDERSRQGWLENQAEAIKLATQVRESKNFPWPNASNVKYPLLTVAAMQFHARAYPALLPDNYPVKTKICGGDPDGRKRSRAERVRKYMSYQVMEGMPEWVDDFDRLLFVLPMIGLCYKKTYYSELYGRNRSVLLLPREVIVNYHAKDYTSARMTHRIDMSHNELIENQRNELFLDIELPEPNREDNTANEIRDEINSLNPPDNNEDDTHTIFEVHGWWDLDDDGFKEPYIITVDKQSEKVLRIVSRWTSFKRNSKKQISGFELEEFFTPFKFLPDPESAVYGIGFGSVLGPTNEAANSLINQLVDAGTLSNLQAGFISRGLKIKGGVTGFKPGEWKIANMAGGSLKDAIFPLPVREPSGALFNLLQLLIQSGERISAVSEIMLGENPGQNTPATTSMTMLEQGMKVFTGIYKRIHRQLGEEFKKLYRLNYEYLDENYYRRFLDEDTQEQMEMLAEEGNATPEELMEVQARMEQENAQSGRNDFNPEDMDVLPVADPNMASDAQKMIKSQSLMEKVAAGFPINPMVALMRSLEAEGHEDIQELLEMPEQGPSRDEMEMELEALKEEREWFTAQQDAILKRATAIKAIADAEAAEEGTQLNIYHGMVEDMLKVIEMERGGTEGANQSGGGSTPTQTA